MEQENVLTNRESTDKSDNCTSAVLASPAYCSYLHNRTSFLATLSAKNAPVALAFSWAAFYKANQPLKNYVIVITWAKITLEFYNWSINMS